MSATTEYKGQRALEYAAQTGARLMRRRPVTGHEEQIAAAVARALWNHGAADQIFCFAIDHAALAAAERAGWAWLAKHGFRQLTRVPQRLARALQATHEERRALLIALLLLRHALLERWQQWTTQWHDHGWLVLRRGKSSLPT